MALLVYGLISVLILLRIVVLDKADAARIAATRPPASAEQDASWDDRVKFLLGYVCSDFLFWIVMASLACNWSIFLGLAVIVCWGLLIVLCVKIHTRADAPS